MKTEREKRIAKQMLRREQEVSGIKRAYVQKRQNPKGKQTLPGSPASKMMNEDTDRWVVLNQAYQKARSMAKKAKK